MSIRDEYKVCNCGHKAYWEVSCGAFVCPECENHIGLARCYCGWNKKGNWRGREELQELGEVLEPDEG